MADAQKTPTQKVSIIGGGTAGWMAAAALSHYFGDRLDITLVESDAIGTVGVGEATIPQIRLFNKALGINEADFLRETHGTIKLGIEFVGWHTENSRYFHGFGDVGRAIGLLPFYQYWLRYHSQGGARDLEEFSPNALAAHQGKYGTSQKAIAAKLPASAYHFDAGAYAAFLSRYAKARGVKRIEGVVEDARLSSDGHIEFVSLASGQKLSADLFIDCSGFRALLIGQHLGSAFEDWTHWLPCDLAFAVPSKGSGKLDPFTRAIAHPVGWQWQIPLQHRTGNGRVYASAFVSDEDARQSLLDALPGEALSEPKQLKFTTGKRREIWKGNCVALGLASGFLEPLESTSIHLIQAGIARLVSLFPDQRCQPELAAEYNRQMDFEFTAVRDFLILHYHVTAREDSEFWRYCRTMDIPDSLREKLELFRSTGSIVRFNTELFDIPSWLQVMWGQGLRPARHHPMVDAASEADLARYIKMNARETGEQVTSLADHEAFIARIMAKG